MEDFEVNTVKQNIQNILTQDLNGREIIDTYTKRDITYMMMYINDKTLMKEEGYYVHEAMLYYLKHVMKRYEELYPDIMSYEDYEYIERLKIRYY